jgi:acyl-CoA reductase-like NAD-dependent aldehyde dehydrogenase
MAVATEREYGLFINGESTEPASGEIRELSEPATGEPLARVASAGEEDVDRAVAAAQAALAGEWGKTPPTERSRLLHALADAIQANRKELAELEARNVGKAISSVKAELAQGVENFRFYASAIASIAGRSNPIGGSLLFYSLKEPVGVAGQIVPWNYPLMMTTWKLAPALAAGCTIVLKPDSATPLTALRMAELAAEVGFPPGTLNVVPGPGTTVGAHLVRHPGVDKIAFTGSTATGSEIMRLGADTIKRLTLELGGKSPNIVFADANLEDAIPSSVWSIYYSAGQSCEARSRMLVEASLYDEFVSSFSEAAKRLKVGDPLEAETQVGSLISGEHPRQGSRLRRAGARGRRRGRRRRRAPRWQGRVLSADRARERRQPDDGRPGGDLRARRNDHAVRGREGRGASRQRRQVRPDGHGLDRGSRARTPARPSDQGRHRWDQHAVHGVPGNPVRRLQAVGLRSRAGHRDTRALPGDEECPRLDEPEAFQPVRAVVGSIPRYLMGFATSR